MAFQATQDGCMVVQPHDVGSQTFTNTLWFSKADFDVTDQLALAQMIENQWFTRLDAYFHNSCIYGPPAAYDMRTIDGPIVPAGVSVNVGNLTGDMMPLSTALVVTHYTAKRGRAHRGRTYLAGFTEADYTAHEWDGDLVNAVQLMFATIASSAASLGWTFGVRSGVLDGVTRNPAVITPITQSIVRSKLVGSQRRRVGRP